MSDHAAPSATGAPANSAPYVAVMAGLASGELRAVVPGVRVSGHTSVAEILGYDVGGDFVQRPLGPQRVAALARTWLGLLAAGRLRDFYWSLGTIEFGVVRPAGAPEAGHYHAVDGQLRLGALRHLCAQAAPGSRVAAALAALRVPVAIYLCESAWDLWQILNYRVSAALIDPETAMFGAEKVEVEEVFRQLLQQHSWQFARGDNRLLRRPQVSDDHCVKVLRRLYVLWSQRPGPSVGGPSFALYVEAFDFRLSRYARRAVRDEDGAGDALQKVRDILGDKTISVSMLRKVIDLSGCFAVLAAAPLCIATL